MAVLLVEQYFEFAKTLADAYVVMDRGVAVVSGRMAEIDEAKVKQHLMV